MPIIDADAHVVETDRTWDFMDEADQAFRPDTVVSNNPNAPKRLREFWRIDGRFFARRVFDVEHTGTTDETRELQSIEKRLRHMDQLGVDVHVLYPTVFLSPITTRPEVEVALHKSYNRWMADIWSKGEGRLLWAALAPTLDMEKAVAEVRWAKNNGACAIFIRGLEGGRVLSSPYFFPLYEEAVKLDMPVCIHSGNGSFALDDVAAADTAIMYRAKFSALGAFHEIILAGLPQRFPGLRIGMIETSASWVPYLSHDLAARYQRMFSRKFEGNLLKENRVWVACLTDDDLPYVLQYAGEDNLVIGSDYGHADTSSEIDAIRKLKTDGKVPARAIDKILDDNARVLYGL
ncbi:MAG: amidohydrolase family protein [Chloroflexota bacterium]